MDEDNARVMVKLTLTGKIFTLSQYGVRLVGKKEYNKYSKYLSKYDVAFHKLFILKSFLKYVIPVSQLFYDHLLIREILNSL